MIFWSLLFGNDYQEEETVKEELLICAVSLVTSKKLKGQGGPRMDLEVEMVSHHSFQIELQTMNADRV